MLTRKQHVDYWLHGALENIKDMRVAIKSKRRAMAMFCGHLAIEKMLKGLCAVRDFEVWRDHKLLNLADNAGLTDLLTDEQLEELAIITGFNIEARYDDTKKRFHDTCTCRVVEENYNLAQVSQVDNYARTCGITKQRTRQAEANKIDLTGLFLKFLDNSQIERNTLCLTVLQARQLILCIISALTTKRHGSRQTRKASSGICRLL